jgi:PAS domain S-box-containing protein
VAFLPKQILAEPTVKALSERLNRALNAARMVAWEWDLKSGRILYSGNAPDVLGISSHEAEMSWAAVHPDDLATLRGIVNEAVAGHREYVARVRFIRPDNGALRWLEIRGNVICESGTPASITGVTLDVTDREAAEQTLRRTEEIVTERKAAEEALRRSEHELRVHQTELELQNEELRLARERLEASQARYFDLYDLAPVGYLTLSEGGMIREANLKAASLLGVPRNALPNRPLSRFVFKDDNDAYYLFINSLAKTGSPQACELRMTKQDTAPFWAQVDATASVDQDGTPGWRIVISEITGRKQAEESLRQSEERLRAVVEQVREMNVGLERRVEERTRALQEANRELEAFGYSVSHDLRAPLRTLQGFSQALLEDYVAELPPKARGYLERIGVAAARLDELIQDLLTYSRLSRAELRLEPLDLSGVVREACQQLQAVIEESRATVEVGPLPVVRGHHGTLVQIFANLFSNSLKFVSPGERPAIRISAEPRGSMVRVWIADNGIGIEPEHQERIFEVFQRLHGLETHPGTGIGLAIVRRGAERLGGAAGVESEPGRGSRFWVDLKPAEDK